MKIGYDAKRYFFNNTGLGNYSRYVVDGMSELKTEYELFLFSAKGESNNRTVVSHNGNRFMAKLWRMFGVVDTKEFKDLDVFHGLSNEIPLKKTSVKRIVTIHDVIFKHLPQTQSSINRWIYDFKTRRSAILADKIIATSNFTKSDLINFYGVDSSKIEVVYQDCLPQFYDLEIQNKQVTDKYGLKNSYILCTGTIEFRKSQLDLIKAFEGLDFDGDLVLLGRKTKYFSEIDQFLKNKQSLKDRIIVLDETDFEDFPAIYKGASLFVYPSICEGFGIPILEAMNTGVPTITTKDTVMEEVGGDAVNYFEGNNVNDLRKKITNLLSDKALQKELIEKGFQQVLKFRKEVTLAQMAKIYQELI